MTVPQQDKYIRRSLAHELAAQPDFSIRFFRSSDMSEQTKSPSTISPQSARGVNKLMANLSTMPSHAPENTCPEGTTPFDPATAKMRRMRAQLALVPALKKQVFWCFLFYFSSLMPCWRRRAQPALLYTAASLRAPSSLRAPRPASA